MGTKAGRYIYAVDRKIVAAEREAIIVASAEEAGVRPPIIQIVFSDAENRAGKGIAAVIEEAIRRCERLGHVVLIITHAGLNMVTYDMLGVDRPKWHLLVDETPDFFEMVPMDTGPLLIPFLREHYVLQDGGRIDPTRPIGAREFDRPSLVRRGGATASVTEWAETAEPWRVTRSWNVELLRLFVSATFFADSFSQTITYRHLVDQGVEFDELLLDDHRVWKPRRVTIFHYVRDHEASASKFKDAAFRPELVKIAAHLAALGIERHLWTTNEAIRSVFEQRGIEGELVTPKQAGSNRWATWHDATIIYAARPSPAEIVVHGEHGMTEDDVVAARGGYDIRQFVMRLSLRDPDSAEPVSVRVYDAMQAQALKRYLDETYGFRCEIEQIDLGIRSPERKRGPRPVLSAEEQKARKKRLNAASYQRKKAA